MKSRYIYVSLTISLFVVGALLMYVSTKSGTVDANYDRFAECLGENGATFYGAFWCPHCQEQKALLQNSKLMPYVECSTPDGEAQTETCIAENITSYPTWKFSDGTVLQGAQTLTILRDKTDCPLP